MSSTHSASTFLRTDLTTQAVADLEKLVEEAQKLVKSDANWKWVLYALKDAAQNMMHLSILRSDGSGGESVEDMNRVAKGKQPRGRLPKFMEFYERVKSEGVMGRFYGSKPFEATEPDDEDIAWLNDFRNWFAHQRQVYRSHDCTGMPERCRTALRLIEFLGWESNVLSWNGTPEEERAGELLAQMREILAAVDVRHAAARQ